MLRISVIITNYNYGRYVDVAIQSALSLNGGAEVIVVDDGSTDNSRSVIDAFGSSVYKIYQTNQSQTAAYNAGFAASTGDVVIFLDSDDLLDPSVGEELGSVWNERVSKVQFQMQRIDEYGRPRGGVFPAYLPLPTPERIRHWVMTTGGYPSPPASGNAYARRWLKEIFPLDPEADRAGDSFCLSVAPLFGDVVTVAKPLVFYRVHGANDSGHTSFAMHADRAMKRFKYSQGVARHRGVELADRLFFRNLETTQFRAASMRFAREQHPIPDDSPLRAARNALWALAFCPQVELRRRGVLVLWVFGVLLLPLPLAKKAVVLRYRR